MNDPSIVPTEYSGAFQLTQQGVRTIGDDTPGEPVPMPGEEPHQSSAEFFLSRQMPAPGQPRQIPQRRPPAPPQVTPRYVLKLARARVKELGAQIKQLKSLEREKAELERMIAAAKKAAPVRSITSARNAG